jgi:hypothetical protein
MNVWLDTGLQTFVSVLILYYAVNTFWRYHPIAKARHVVAIVVVSALIMFAYLPGESIRLLWFLGIGVLIEIVWLVLERKQKLTVYILFLTDRKHQSILSTYFSEGQKRHMIEESAIRFLFGSASILGVTTPSSSWKSLLKEFERDYRTLVPVLAMRAYVTVLFALILLAAYWRFWS